MRTARHTPTLSASARPSFGTRKSVAARRRRTTVRKTTRVLNGLMKSRPANTLQLSAKLTRTAKPTTTLKRIAKLRSMKMLLALPSAGGTLSSKKTSPRTIVIPIRKKDLPLRWLSMPTPSHLMSASRTQTRRLSTTSTRMARTMRTKTAIARKSSGTTPNRRVPPPRMIAMSMNVVPKSNTSFRQANTRPLSARLTRIRRRRTMLKPIVRNTPTSTANASAHCGIRYGRNARRQGTTAPKVILAKNGLMLSKQATQNDIDTNCQAMVNGNAGCIPDPNYFLGTATFEFTKNDCEEHYTGSKVTISSEDPEITGRPFVSRTSQADANAKALAAVKAQGQALANERGYCEEDQKWEGKYSQEFTKNNCADDGVGGKVIVTQEDVTGYPFISYVSQEEATNAAKAAVQAQGQAIANTKGNCTWFGTYSKEFTKDDCPAGREPSSMTVTQDDVTGRPFISNVSQADANSKAQAAVEAQGQQVANDYGNCEAVTVYIGHFSKEFTPECEECHTGEPMEVTEVNCGGPFSSYESQAAADALAQAAVLAQGQAYANKNGTCNEDDRSAWWNDVSPLETRCNDCVSQKKQVDTNPCSPTYNTNRWVDGGGRTCQWEGHYSQAFQKNDCEIEGAGTTVTVKETQISTYPFMSCVSQEDADNKAKAGVQEEGQAVANKNGMCRYKGVYSKQFTKSNCGTCTHGVAMTVDQEMVTGGPFWSEISQDDANSKAKEAVEAQGQAYANTHGSCEDDDKTPNWVAKQEFECQDGQSMQKYVDENPCSETADEIDWRPGGTLTCEWTGHASKQFTDYCLDGGVESGPITITEADVTGGPFTSTVSQEDANQKAMAAVEEQGLALARERGTCTWTAVAQGQYTKNDCGTCEQGEVMTVTSTLVNGTAVTSTISKEDAENKAKQVLADGAQAYVNKNGDCTDLKVSPVWTNTGSTQCVTSGSSCKGQRQKKNTAECAYENGSPVALNATKWFDDSSVGCGYGSWQTDTSYGSDGCSGCTYHRVRYNGCGQADYDSESNASTCGTTATDWDCDYDTYTKHTWYYNTCSGSTWGDDYESNSEDCGYDPCVPNWQPSGNAFCRNNQSYITYKDGCGHSEDRKGGEGCSYNCGGKSTGSEGDCTYEKVCNGTQYGSTTDAAKAKCNCTTTYTRTYNRALSDSECNSRCKTAGYDKGVSNGVAGTWSGTGSTCRAADSAATSNFNNNSSYSTYCDCSNNPEPVKKGTIEVRNANQGTTACGGSIDIGRGQYSISLNGLTPNGSYSTSVNAGTYAVSGINIKGNSGGGCTINGYLVGGSRNVTVGAGDTVILQIQF